MKKTLHITAMLVSAWMCSAQAANTNGLTGTWVAHPEVRGQVGEIVIAIEAAAEGSLRAFLELPQIQSRRVGLGGVVADGNTVRTGPFVLSLSDDGKTLTGVVPEALLPIYETVAVFSRATRETAAVNPRNLGRQVEPAWTFAAGGPIWGGALAVDGALYFGADDGHLYALDAGTGALRWKIRTGGAIRATPSAIGNGIVFQSDDGYLYRVTAGDGSITWRTSLGRGEPHPVDRGSDEYVYDHYASAVTVAGGSGYVGTYDGDLVRVDLETGNILWRFAADGPVLGHPVLGAELVVLASWDGHVYALTAETGNPVWQADTGGVIASSPAIHAGAEVFVGTRGYDLLALDLHSGRRLWDRYFWFSWVEAPPLVVGGSVFAAGSDGGAVLALDVRDGRRQWAFDTTGSIWAPLVYDDAVLYVAAVGVRNYMVPHEPGFFAVDRRSGEPWWHYAPEDGSTGDAPLSGFAAAPAVDGGLVFAGSLDGKLYAFPVKGGGQGPDAISAASPQTTSPDQTPDF